MTSSKIQVMSDRFDQGALNASLWTNPFDVQGTVHNKATIGTVTSSINLTAHTAPNVQLSTQAEMTVPTINCFNSGVGSVATYDLSNSGIYAQFVTYSGHGSSPYPQTAFGVTDGVSYPNNHSIAWLIAYDGSSVNIMPTYWSPSLTYPVGYTVTPYDSSVHRYLRIVESNGVVYWDYSSDGNTWVTMSSTATPFSVTNMYVTIYAVYCDAAPGPSQWGNVGYALSSS